MRYSNFGHLTLCAISISTLTGVSNPTSAEPTQKNSSIQGTFPFNETIIAGLNFVPPGTTTCPTTTTQNPQPVGTAQQQLTLTNQGYFTFDGSGNVTIADTGVNVTSSSSGITVAASVANCTGTYEVQPGGTVAFNYVCSLPVSSSTHLEFNVHSLGILTPTNILLAVPPADTGGERVSTVYLVPNGLPQSQGSLAACAIVGENTNIVRVGGAHVRWPIDSVE